jgi:hypothetical protein
MMHATTDATAVDMQPIKDHAKIWGLYSVAFLLLGTFFMLNLCVVSCRHVVASSRCHVVKSACRHSFQSLTSISTSNFHFKLALGHLDRFVGVIIDNFNRIRREEGKSVLVTEEQEKWRR